MISTPTHSAQGIHNFHDFSLDGQEKDKFWWLCGEHIETNDLHMPGLMFLEIIDVTGIHRTGDKLWLWRTVCNGTGSEHRQLTLLHMICMPLIAYMNSDLTITLRFSGEGTKNSHMVCPQASDNRMPLFGLYHIKSLNTAIWHMLILSDSGERGILPVHSVLIGALLCLAGWWYGAVGHLESCDGNEHFCRCHLSGENISNQND
jgi:hypothetical protein